jgi:hypothetical protein
MRLLIDITDTLSPEELDGIIAKIENRPAMRVYRSSWTGAIAIFTLVAKVQELSAKVTEHLKRMEMSYDI